MPAKRRKKQRRSEFENPPVRLTMDVRAVGFDPYDYERRKKYLTAYHFRWYTLNMEYVAGGTENDIIVLKEAKFQVTPEGEVIPGEGFSETDPDMVKVARKMVKQRKPYRSKKEQDIISRKEFDRAIPDEAAALAFHEQVMWGDTPFCPKCGSENVRRTKDGKPQSHRCRDCRGHFNARSGTAMEGSQIDTKTWLLAIREMHQARKGQSHVWMCNEYGLTWNSAWFMCQRIREAMDAGNEKLAGIVEIDETWSGGVEKNKHAKKKLHGHWQDGKVPVFGMRDYTGKVILFPISGVDKKTLEELVLKYVEQGATVNTDGHMGYRGLGDLGYNHQYVDHSVGEYVRGMATTNGIESIWAIADRAYVGTFHYISPKHLARYMNEIAYRVTAGPGSGFETIARTLRNMKGHRLKWLELIANPTDEGDSPA